MLDTHSTGYSMYRDRLRQHRQSDQRFVETADSTARARDYQRRQRAELLEMFLQADAESFDRHFLEFYDDDNAIILVLSDPAAQRGLGLITPREVQ